MHRTVEITTATHDTELLLRELEPLKEVTGLSVSHGASIKTKGDVITVHVLNRGADEVLKRAREHGGERVSIVTAELTSIIDKQHEEAVDRDVDEAVWEEMETGLRHQGRVTANFIALMALGGAIAAIGLVSEPAPQAIAFVAASIIAPGFEPLAKIPLGIVLGRWNIVWRGLVSSVVGYAVLVLAAALTMFVLLATHSVEVSELVGNPEVKNLASPKLKEMIVSGAAAVAGMVMIAAYRRGKPQTVRSAIDANAGGKRVEPELVQLATRQPAALMGFAGRVPGVVSSRIDLGNEQLSHTFKTVRVVYGSVAPEGDNFEMLTVLRATDANAAQELSQTLVALQSFIPGLINQLPAAIGRVAASNVRDIRITAEGNEVSVRVQLVPPTSVAATVSLKG